jgi:DNA mismatch repair protein MutS2
LIAQTRTLEDLNFGEILAALAQRCRTQAAKDRALTRPFLESREQVETALAQVEEARALLLAQRSLPLGGAADIRLSLDRAEKGGLLEPRELIATAQTLFAFARLKEGLAERATIAPRLAEIGKRLPSLESMASRIDCCFEADGEISDRASPELKEARDRCRGLHRSIKGRLDVLLHDDHFLVNLRETYYTLRNGRYVVPVLSSHQAQVPGIVHNASQSGQTLFVEPEGMVGLGNQLAIAQSVQLEEERRVLQTLTDLVGREVGRIGAGVEALAELDEAEAAAQLAIDLSASSPAVEAPDGALELLGLRHPLLVLRGKEVVANDVRLSGDVRAMVVSGPNAGGKTVTLTGVGVCALMLRAGLPVPAENGSRMPLFNAVHSAVGDAQDLHQDLSTFSAHVLELRRILEEARPGTLALVDEIAADTDPREGAALAIATLEALLEKGARVLVTTHLEELKALTHVDPRFQNARVGFDSRKMQPTYKLQLGAAGSSSAIELALRMGLPQSVCEKARALAQNQGGPLARAISAAEEERRKLSDELERTREIAAGLEREKAAMIAERAALETRLRDEERQRREQLTQELARAADDAKELIARLRQERSLEAAEAMRRQLLDRRAEQESRVTSTEAEQARAQTSAPAELVKGQWVHHFGLERDVEVLEVSGDQVTVAAGPMKMRVPKDQLGPAASRKPKPRFPAQSKPAERLARAEEAAPAAVNASNLRCDVRGMRVDEAIREVDSFLDRALRGNESAATVLHGHGTGALKQALRDHLGQSPYVRMYRPGESHEGGDGVTVVSLRTQ